MPEAKLLVKSMNRSELTGLIKTFFHPKRITLVVILALVFAILGIMLPSGGPYLHNVLLGLLGVAGTMVALIPATAAIFETLVSRQINEIDNDLLAPDAPKRDHDLSYVFALKSVDNLNSIGLWAWTGSLYVFSALLVILFGLFIPVGRFILLGFPLLGWLIAMSLAFLVVGTVFFGAFALRVYRLDSLTIRKMVLEDEYQRLKEALGALNGAAETIKVVEK